MENSLLLQRPRLNYTGVIKHKSGKDYYFPPHHHQDVTELLLIVEGQSRYVIDGKEYQADAGTLICFNQGFWHEEASDADEPFEMWFLGFSGLQLHDLPANFILDRQRPQVNPLTDSFFTIRARFGEIVKEKQSSIPESQVIADHLLTVLIAELTRILHHRSTNTPRRLQQRTQSIAMTKRYIEEHYHEPVTLKQLAKVAYVSPFHLSHLFKQEQGCSPIQYLIQYRMEVAKYYLTSTDLTVDKIAKLVGYESETYFQNAFKKMVGTPPGRYRTFRQAEPEIE